MFGFMGFRLINNPRNCFPSYVNFLTTPALTTTKHTPRKGNLFILLGIWLSGGDIYIKDASKVVSCFVAFFYLYRFQQKPLKGIKNKRTGVEGICLLSIITSDRIVCMCIINWLQLLLVATTTLLM